MESQLNDYNIEYELPFLRAIYFANISATSKDMAVVKLLGIEPKAIVRDITIKN